VKELGGGIREEGMGPFQEQGGLVCNEEKCSNRYLAVLASCCDSIHTVTYMPLLFLP